MHPCEAPTRRSGSFLLLALLLPLASRGDAQGRAPAAADLAARVAEVHGALAFERARLVLPADAPRAFTVAVSRAGARDVLVLERYSMRASAAQGLSFDGRWRGFQLPEVATYRGAVRGVPGAEVVASLGADGLSARVFVGGAPAWTVAAAHPLDARLGRADHVVFDAPPEPPPALPCGVTESGSVPPPASPGGRVAWEPLAPCLKVCQVAFDADFEYYQARGSSVANVVARIEEHMNVVDFFYARDARCTYRLTAFVVRTAPFYAPASGGDLLNQFAAEWTGNLAGIPRDVAHLMTAKPGSLIEFGGLAFVGVMCSSNLGYGWSMDSANIIGHELGHNWGAPHCLDPSPCNTMCGGCFYIGPVTREVVLATRASAPCLADAPPYAFPVPPYAVPERLAVRKSELDSLAGRAVDVLANDADGNCQAVRIDAFDATTARGGSVALAPGAGPEGRDLLVYTPPAVPFLGDESFGYRVGDGTGLVGYGTVAIDVLPRALAGYWRLDEGGGLLAGDASGAGRDGTVAGGPSWVSGVWGTALELDGVDDAVSVPALGLDTDHATIACWVRRNGAQSRFSGLVWCRGGSTVAGLNLDGARVRYTWNDAFGIGGWSSGLSVPDGQWAFVALVVEPERATVHVWDGSLHSAVNAVPHAREEFDAPLFLGFDPAANARHLQGALDDVRVLPYALSADEILSLAESGGPAEGPVPVDGGALPVSGGALAWAGSPAATSHDVYFGASYAAVRDATPASPEFAGNQAAASYLPGVLAPEATYFWRVDEHAGATTVPGEVWQFDAPLFRHWRLDEPSGLVAADSMAGDDGTYVGGAILNQSGATPATGSAVFLDGVNDQITLPALDLATNRATITLWVRRFGPQPSFAGLVFSRAGTTVAGLNLGTALELRYHWNGEGSTFSFDSGLVLPDDSWVFAALVVEPTRATLWLGQDGVLSSAVNPVAHAVEAFDGATLIGRDPSGSRRLRGYVDDVRVYDVALSAAEIRSLYQQSL